MRNFLSLCLANFLLFFGFYAVMTLLPFYMDEVVHASHATTGIALTALTVATVVVRPIGGYIYDLIQRRPLYLGAYLLFVCSVAGYAWCTVSGLIIAMRVVGGHLADRIAPQRLIYVGISLCVATYAVTGLLPMGSRLLPHAWLLGLYLLLALCVGTAFGILHPAFNKLMLSLTTADHRGAASSTYLTGFDLGIGTGFLIGGAVASATDSYSMGYLLGAATAVAGLVSFWMWQRQATHSPQKP